jgi:hypothetical protein
MTKPIKNMIQLIQALALGKLDQKYQAKKKDEIAEMTEAQCAPAKEIANNVK